MKLRVALIYPAPYEIGIANLGFNSVFRLINSTEGFICDRIFYNGKINNIDSNRDIKEYHILAFSISFLTDYLKIPEIINSAGIPVFSTDREEFFPLVIGGGNAFSLNPEPVADIFDAIIIGDAEGIIEKVLFEIKNGKDKWKLLEKLNEIPSTYVPSLNTPRSRKSVFKNRNGNSLPAWSEDGGNVFKDAGLVEIGRGCRWKCSFCPIGFLHAPPRFYDVDTIIQSVRKTKKQRIGLIAPVVPDHPSIKELLKELKKEGYRITTSSWRADLYDPELFELLKDGQKTLTIAPETGSERLRKKIGKDITNEKILEGVNLAKKIFKNLKAYFIIGLPGEKDEDIKETAELCREMSKTFEKKITLSINPFIPLPHTPLMNEDFSEKEILRKMEFLRKEVQKFATFKSKSIAETRLEFILAWSGREILREILKDPALKKVKTGERIDLGFIEYPFNQRSLRSIIEKGNKPCPTGCNSCLFTSCKIFRY
jgi:radical SAM superfamily enzyme YgiQ (UPF0313 family)